MYTESVAEPPKSTHVTGEDGQPMSPARQRFYASEQCTEALAQLQAMVDSGQYETRSSYYGTDSLSFIERHLHYLSLHPTLQLTGYISNLKLMTRIRGI